MSVAAAVFAKLSGTSAVTDIVPATKIFPVRPTQGIEAPYIIFQQITATPATTHNEAATTAHRLFQVACFVKTFEDSVALRDAVIAALDNQALSNGEKPVLEDERDGDFDDAVGLYRADADFLI